MVCGSCEPKTLTVEEMKNMTSEQIIAAYRQGYKLVQGGASQPQVMSQDWQNGGVKSLVAPITCPTGKRSADPVTLTAAPNGGVFPYTVRFWRGTGTAAFPFIAVGTSQSPATEGAPVSQNWTLSDVDVATATGDDAAMEPIGVVVATGLPTVDTVLTRLLANATIRVLATTVDSCPTGAGGPASCIRWCDVTLACVPPTCNFVVI